MYVVAPTCIPCKISTQEWEARESGVQGYSRPYNQYEVRLRCMRPCLQTKKTKKIVPVAVVSLLSFEKDD